MAAIRRSVVSPSGRHTASLIFLHGSGGGSGPGRGAGESLPLQRGSAGSVAALSGGAAARHGGAEKKEIRLRVPRAPRL